jgi:hypothetical protein
MSDSSDETRDRLYALRGVALRANLLTGGERVLRGVLVEVLDALCGLPFEPNFDVETSGARFAAPDMLRAIPSPTLTQTVPTLPAPQGAPAGSPMRPQAPQQQQQPAQQPPRPRGSNTVALADISQVLRPVGAHRAPAAAAAPVVTATLPKPQPRDASGVTAPAARFAPRPAPVPDPGAGFLEELTAKLEAEDGDQPETQDDNTLNEESGT